MIRKRLPDIDLTEQRSFDRTFDELKRDLLGQPSHSEAQQRVEAERLYHERMQSQMCALYTPLHQPLCQDILPYPGPLSCLGPAPESYPPMGNDPPTATALAITEAARALVEAYVISEEAVIPAVQLGRPGAVDPDALIRELERIIRKHYPLKAVDPVKDIDKLVPMKPRPQPQPAEKPTPSFPDSAKRLPPMGEPWRPAGGK